MIVRLNSNQFKQQISQKAFIEQGRVHHGDLYDYTDVTHCEDQSTKVTVVCQTHGPWTSSWASHIQYKRGCPTCGSNQQLLSRDSQAVESFVTKSQAIHGVKYDYTNTTRQVNLEGSRYNYLFSVMCPEHGEWWTRSKHHFRKDPSGCPKCGIRKPAKTTESWIAAAISVHGNKYTYERAEFGDGLSKIIVTCPTHGDFEVYPYRFTNKHKTGCAGCAQKAQHTRSSFVTKATTVHFGKYDYSLVGEFANIKSKIQVVCPKHGAFTTTVQQHANSLVGCKKCKESRGEAIISHILKLKSINFIQEHRFGDCRNPMTNKLLPFDFWLPDHNLCIEFHGVQHYQPSHFGRSAGAQPMDAEVAFFRGAQRDRLKEDYCRSMGIELLIIKYNQLDEISEILGTLGAK